MHISLTPTDALNPESHLQNCIDALAGGDCTEEEFLSQTIGVRDSEAESAWHVLSVIDQRYRRGQLAGAIFHSIKSRIAQRVLHDRRDGITIELPPTFPSTGAVDHTNTDFSVPMAAPANPDDPPPERPAIHVGSILRNRYVVESLLGRGGMGDVFKASDGLGAVCAESHAHVAVKVLRERIDRRPELMARLQREFDCTRKLSHPNVVKVYEFDRNEEFGFYTMELLEGEHLGDLLERVDRHPLPHPYAWAIIGAVGAALAHAHSRNVIHGDVSPKNVMITRGGEVRVLDFGSSTTANGGGPPGESEARRTVAATPAYASCEVLEGQRADPRDDLYALACLAYELLTGEHPFQGKRSIEARDLGMRPRRPPGLRFSRWRAIQRGLSWTREGRSIPVRQWLGQLGIEPEPERLPPFRETTKSGPYLPSLNMSKRMALVIAAFVGIALAWSSIHRGSRGLDSTGSQTASKALRAAGESIAAVQANRSEPSTSTTPVHLRVLPSDRAIASLDVAPPVPVNGPPESPHPVPHRAAGAPRPTSARSIQFTSNRYSAVSSAHFVETHVWRSRTSGDTNSFVWWTDNSSAKAGIDFVAQAPTPYRFSAGRQLASLFVRLIPNPGRSQAKDFHVCLGKRSTGSALTDVTCSAILLPAHADRPS